ncbi:hypothetical protein [Nocardia farcinica]|nr:hypothetical protein [Nocardia farcinica]
MIETPYTFAGALFFLATTRRLTDRDATTLLNTLLREGKELTHTNLINA